MTTGTLIWLSAISIILVINLIATIKNTRRSVKNKTALDMHILKNKSLK